MPDPPVAGALLGKGRFVSGKSGFDGIVSRADSVQAVFELIGTDLSETILLTDQASATYLAPVLPELRAIICTAGGESAHLAIVSRGLGLPCLMQTELYEEVPAGRRVVVDDSGVLHGS
jgi:phosphoenolpyruvate synthase/pyruvate phosphate dikinase